tara:strand:- start:192 stop:437 length:246 start_codon:yes stop_codon:yes gene_type:complete
VEAVVELLGHDVQELAPDPLYRPAAQLVQLPEPVVEDFPAAQVEQELLPLRLLLFCWYFPAGHLQQSSGLGKDSGLSHAPA